MTETERFLGALFGSKPDDAYALIWTLPDKAAKLSTSLATLAAHAAMRAPVRDVYAGVGLRGAASYPNGGRGGAADVIGLAGLWADIDIAGPAHRSDKRYPESAAAAMALISDMPLAPTLVVHSGHGLQPWWLFNECYLFDDAADRARAGALAQGWLGLLQQHAQTRGVVVDAVHDLARVLRVPGTVNRKMADAPAPVRLLSESNARYGGLLDFEEWVGRRAAPSEPAAANTSALVFAADAQPPFSKWEALRENDARFRQTWERRRRDLSDSSASGYEMALASQLAEAGWSDQEIVDTAIAWRRKHGEEVTKALRADYWQRTLGRARSEHHQREALMSVLSFAEPQPGGDEQAGGEPGESAPLSGAQKDELRAKLSDWLGLPVARWVQHGEEQAHYDLVLVDERRVTFKNVAAVTRQERFNDALFEAVARSMPPLKKTEWHTFLQALGRIVEIDASPEATGRQSIHDWLRSYLANRKDDPERRWHFIDKREPFFFEGHVWVCARQFRIHILTAAMEEVALPELVAMLKRVGFTRDKAQQRRREKEGMAKGWYWHAPRAVMEFETTAEEAAS